MALSKKELQKSLYIEHVGEIGALLQHRLDYFVDNEISWPEVGELERRIAAHLDALVLGEGLAQHVALDLLQSADEDELLGAVYTLSAINQDEFADRLLVSFVEAEDDLVGLFIKGLCNIDQSGFKEKVYGCLSHKNPIVRSAGLKIVSAGGRGQMAQIAASLQDEDDGVRSAAIDAIRKSGSPGALALLEPVMLADEGGDVGLLFSSILLGSMKALHILRSLCENTKTISAENIYRLSICAETEDAYLMLSSFSSAAVKKDVVKAIGILGLVSLIDYLFVALEDEDEEVKTTASFALHLMTGAGLLETATVLEEEEPDLEVEDVFGGQAHEGQEEEQKGDRREVEVERLSTQREEWERWWLQNKNNFDSEKRWRYGQPWSLGMCIEEIAHPHSTLENRQRAYWEFTIRSGVHIPFEPDWFVDKQLDAIAKMSAWWQENQNSYSGQWLFHGK